MAEGDIDVGDDPIVGKKAGVESSLSSWAGPYVTDMLGRGAGLADDPYYAYEGPLTAGESGLQQQAFQGLAGLAVPDNMGAFTPGSFTDQGTMDQYINPYIQGVLNPQLDELRRQTDISRQAQAGKLTRAGAFGGSRQQLADTELTRAMLDKMTGATGKAYADAFERGRDQFNIEQRTGQQAQEYANRYGLEALAAQQRGGDIQRGIEQEGILADRLQFEEERDFPYKQVQYLQSLLQELPLAAQTNFQVAPNAITQATSGATGILGLLGQLFPDLLGGGE